MSKVVGNYDVHPRQPLTVRGSWSVVSLEYHKLITTLILFLIPDRIGSLPEIDRLFSVDLKARMKLSWMTVVMGINRMLVLKRSLHTSS